MNKNLFKSSESILERSQKFQLGYYKCDNGVVVRLVCNDAPGNKPLVGLVDYREKYGDGLGIVTWFCSGNSKIFQQTEWDISYFLCHSLEELGDLITQGLV